jgi:hypothetical protein
MPVTDTVNEWTFVGDVQSWINEIINAHPDLPFSHSKIEVRGKGSLKRRDLTLYDATTSLSFPAKSVFQTNQTVARVQQRTFG